MLILIYQCAIVRKKYFISPNLGYSSILQFYVCHLSRTRSYVIYKYLSRCFMLIHIFQSVIVWKNYFISPNLVYSSILPFYVCHLTSTHSYLLCKYLYRFFMLIHIYQCAIVRKNYFVSKFSLLFFHFTIGIKCVIGSAFERATGQTSWEDASAEEIKSGCTTSWQVDGAA